MNELSNEERFGGYSPAKRMRHPRPIERKHISTSHTERQNLTMRMSMRRFICLTNGLSKKLQNHKAALAQCFMFYNFASIRQTLRVTPALEAGASDQVWTMEEIVGLIK